MNTFLFAFNAVAPLCLMMALGWFLRHRKIVDDAFLKNGNALIFRVLLPLMLFDYTHKFETVAGFD